MDCLGRSLTSYFMWVSTPGRGWPEGSRKQLDSRGCERAQNGDFPTVHLSGPGMGQTPGGRSTGSERYASQGLPWELLERGHYVQLTCVLSIQPRASPLCLETHMGGCTPREGSTTFLVFALL